MSVGEEERLEDGGQARKMFKHRGFLLKLLREVPSRHGSAMLNLSDIGPPSVAAQAPNRVPSQGNSQ